MELLKLLNTNEVIAQLICFFIIFAILRQILWKRFLNLLEARRDRIATELKDIKDSKAVLANIKEEYERKIASIGELAGQKIEEAAAEGRKVAEVIRLAAEQEGERIIHNAKENIKDELAKAKEDLKNSMVDLTISVAQTVIQEKLSEEEDRRLVEDFLKGMEKK